MKNVTINRTVINVIEGDLVNSKSDAIVIPANIRLLPSGDLRIKVFREAGAQVQVECNRIINELKKSLYTSDAIITSGGKLPSRYIIHTVGPKLGQIPEVKNLMLATWNILKLADEKGLTSIAFHPISLEMLGFSAKICAEVMLPTMKKYLLKENKNLKKISIYLEDRQDIGEFEKLLGNLK